MHSVSSIYYIVTIRRNKYQLSQGKTKSRMAYCFLSSAESLSPWSNEPLEKVTGSISVYNPSLLATLASVIPRAGGWIRSINCELGAFHSGCQRSVFWVPGWYLSWTLTRGGAFLLRFLSFFLLDIIVLDGEEEEIIQIMWQHLTNFCAMLLLNTFLLLGFYRKWPRTLILIKDLHTDGYFDGIWHHLLIDFQS